MTDTTDVSKRESMEAQLSAFETRINTALPCTVTKVVDDTVFVQLDILREFNDEVQPPLVLEYVPVLFNGAGAYNISFPVSKGDTGLVVFAQRDVDMWLKGDVDVPNTLRMHDLSDGIFIPGLRPTANTIIPDNLTITAGSVVVVLSPDGKVTINNGQHELLTLIKELVSILGRTTTVPFTRHSSSTPHPEALITQSEFIALLAKLETF